MTVKTKLTPVRYPGGKSNALKTLRDYFPRGFKEYREPFFGGGSVGLYLMQENRDAVYHVNDLFYPVYCFWKILKSHPYAMVSRLKAEREKYLIPNDVVGKRNENGKKIPSLSAENGRALHIQCRKDIEKSMESKDEFETAFLWYILNKLSYSGMAMIGSYAPLAWDQNFTESCIVKLPNTSALLHSVKHFDITCDDYSTLLGDEGEEVFIFLDPPYKIPHKLYGKDGNMHKGFPHKEFSDKIKLCENHKWMITYNQDPEIDVWFQEPSYHKIPWDLQYTMKAAKRTTTGELVSETNDDAILEKSKDLKSDKSGKKGKELLILNYDKSA